MKVAFHTLGCKVNHYETEAIKEAFVSRGAEVVGEEEYADVYIINTCTVTNIADRKSRQFIRRVKRVNPDAIVAVTGCYAQVAAEEVAEMPEVDLVVGNGRKSEICGLVMRKLQEAREEALPAEEHDSVSCPAEACAELKPADILVLPRSALTDYEDMGQVTSAGEGMIRAYLKIQDGCDRFCSYCLIPYARGPVRSRPKDEIIEELRGMLGNGFREIVLTGINTALYGTEDGADCSLSELLTAIDDMECPEGEDFRIRLSSLEPTVVDKDNVEEIIRHRRLCQHLHLSVQSGSSSVLRSMNRHYSREEYLDIVRAIRDYDPLFGITTDIIVGFPGETQEDFNDSLDIVRQTGFGRTHVFRYSPRRGTAGAAMKDAVPESVKKERAAVLESLGSETAEAFIRANRGSAHRVLIEESVDEYATGYTGNYIKVYIHDSEGRLKAGEFVDAVTEDAFRDGAIARLAN
ncbi:MAG: tRNA (N(6)-L-threonylcarbamoyladenosine(37)-C(2))-methylthiotransferase MtaB [Mogibacterium sp.]|nr:tRNA (N(6)-L-threonylcarbamoyladenosine(37)-C(2))-methylthiotransferase MtaB [Mogibacterium sp.]